MCTDVDFNSAYALLFVCACSVHSRQKHQIAWRLVLGALNVAYRLSSVTFQGPWPTGYMISRSSSILRLNFDSADLYVHNQHRNIGFEASRHLCYLYYIPCSVVQSCTYHVSIHLCSSHHVYIITSYNACSDPKEPKLYNKTYNCPLLHPIQVV